MLQPLCSAWRRSSGSGNPIVRPLAVARQRAIDRSSNSVIQRGFDAEVGEDVGLYRCIHIYAIVISIREGAHCRFSPFRNVPNWCLAAALDTLDTGGDKLQACYRATAHTAEQYSP
jgi:hypothetical protein